MCFVSYIPHQDGFLLGSNRDEHRDRKPAILPKIIETAPGLVVMPLDGKAGGTWIALRNDGISAVLLNGAFINHQRAATYRHSRGLIIPEIMQAENPALAFEKFNLQHLEPFTLVFAGFQLIEWRWDGELLHRKDLSNDQSFCWSSATLYDGVQQNIRENWFRQAISSGQISDADSLLKWQSTGGYGPKSTDIVLDREDRIGTVSTTVVAVFKNTLQMAYQDYLSPLGPEVVKLTGLHNRFHEKKRMVQEAG
jgi:Transport and Golgi organisation 2